MTKIALPLTLVTIAGLFYMTNALPPFDPFDWRFGGFPEMGMMGPWGHMDQNFRQHMISSLEEKCGDWQRNEFGGLNLDDEEQTKVRDLCKGLTESYTAPFELISFMSRRNPSEVPYAQLYQN